MTDGQPSDAAPEARGNERGREKIEKERAAKGPSDYCPVCSALLEPRKCKLICTHCGYYMSCSDYY